MKILLVITGLTMGGAEYVVVNLADVLVARGHEVKIAHLMGKAAILPDNPDIEVVPLGVKSSKDIFKAYIKLRALVKRMKPDIIHSHLYHANLLTRLLRLTIGAPKIISSSHNTIEGGRFRMLTYRLTDKLVNISTNVSQEAVDALVEKGAVKPGRVVSVVNGIDINRFYFNETTRQEKRDELNIVNKKVIVAAGRLVEQKDYPNLLNAVSLLKKQRQDFKVLIAGEGPLKQELISLAKKLEVIEFIEFLGLQSDVPALMSASDIFVLSSAWEGFGLVVAEAMACERIVVATDCGGVGEVVGSEGFLISPRDENALAQALNKALDLDTGERLIMGASARQRIIDHFSLEANVDAYLELYLA